MTLAAAPLFGLLCSPAGSCLVVDRRRARRLRRTTTPSGTTTRPPARGPDADPADTVPSDLDDPLDATSLSRRPPTDGRVPPGRARDPPVALLVNPASGNGRAGQRAPVVPAAARARCPHRGRHRHRRAGASTRQAAALAVPADALIAVGGDGMVHLALQRVVGYRRSRSASSRRGPATTSPDTASASRATRSRRRTGRRRHWRAGRAGPASVRTIDSGAVTAADGGRCSFLAVLCSGFDSAVNERANRMRGRRGQARYDLRDPGRAAAVPRRAVRHGARRRTAPETHRARDARRGRQRPVVRRRHEGLPGRPLDDGLLDVSLAEQICSRSSCGFPERLQGHPRRATGGHEPRRVAQVRLDAPGASLRRRRARRPAAGDVLDACGAACVASRRSAAAGRRR